MPARRLLICLVLLTSWGGTTYGWTSPVIIGLGAACWRSRRPGWSRPGTRPSRSSAEAVPRPTSHRVRDLADCRASACSRERYLPTYLQIVTGVTATTPGCMLLPLIAGLLVNVRLLRGTQSARTGHYRPTHSRAALPPRTCHLLSRWAPDLTSNTPAVPAGAGPGIGLFLPSWSFMSDTAARRDSVRQPSVNFAPARSAAHRSALDRGACSSPATASCRRLLASGGRPPQRAAGSARSRRQASPT